MKYWVILFTLLPALATAGDQLDLKAHSAKFDMQVVAFGNSTILRRQDNGKALRCLYLDKVDSVDGKSLEPITSWTYNKCEFMADGAVTPEEGLITVVKTISSKQYELIVIGAVKFIPLSELSLSYPLTDIHVNKR